MIGDLGIIDRRGICCVDRAEVGEMNRLDIPARIVVQADRTLSVVVGGVSVPVSRVSEWQIEYLLSAHVHEEARAQHIMSGEPGPGGISYRGQR